MIVGSIVIVTYLAISEYDYHSKKLYFVNKLQTMVGAKLACIEGATTPGVTGYTPQYHKLLCCFCFSNV